jgi:polysaccharide biosynthesis protein PslG
MPRTASVEPYERRRPETLITVSVIRRPIMIAAVSRAGRLAIAAAVVVTVAALIIREVEDDRIGDFEVCSTAAEPACEVPPPPCPEAGTRDSNPGNDAVAPLRSATDPESLPYGFNDSAPLVGELSLEQDLVLQRDSGSRIWRLPLDWGAVETDPNAFDFSASDDAYCAALAYGIQPLFHLTGVPPWALGEDAEACSEAPCVQPSDPTHDDALRRFAELVAIRYPEVAALEVWNEPNLTSFWPGPDPARYAEILEAVYLGVKDGRPETIVLGGAVSNNPTDEGGNLSLSTFLSDAFAAGAAEHMDGLSVHAYPIGLLGTANDLFTPQIEAARELVAAAAEGRNVSIWVTETGMPTAEGGFAPAVSEDEQAAQMVAAYETLDAAPDVAAVLFHTLLDPGPDVPGGPGFGWFTAPIDGEVEAKPIVCAFLRLENPAATCPESAELG